MGKKKNKKASMKAYADAIDIMAKDIIDKLHEEKPNLLFIECCVGAFASVVLDILKEVLDGNNS